MKIEEKKSFLINILFFSLFFATFYIFSKFLLSYIFPFVIAFIIAWGVQKPSHIISRKTKIQTKLIAPFLSALIFLFSAALIFFLIYKLLLASKSIFSELPAIFDKVSSFVSTLEEKSVLFIDEISPEFSKQISLFTTDMLNSLRLKLTNIFSSTAATIVKKSPTFLINCIVTLVASCFIAKDFNGLLKFISLLLSEKVMKNILKIKEIFLSSILNIAKGYILLMFITFLELTIGFLILKIKFALLWALIIAVVDLLPVLGTGAVIIPWSILEFLNSNTKNGILLLVIYAFVAIVRNFLEPKIIGNKIGINPLFILLTMFIGLKVFGFIGIFVLPITFIVTIKYYKNEIDEEKKLGPSA